jgi:hypothetical protein
MDMCEQAAEILRAALAEADEPVAWAYVNSDGECEEIEYGRYNEDDDSYITHLYTHPPRREPLTDEQVDALAIDTEGLPASHLELARAIERAHGICTDAAPVAWRTEAARWLRRQADDAELESERTGWANPARHMPDTFRRIADDLEAEQEAAPYGLDCSPEPRREPLTEDEVRRLYRKAWTPESEADEVLGFARAIERAHGIGTDE